MKQAVFLSIIVVLGVLVVGVIWIPAINDCNAVGGELVINAFNWPVCVPSAR